MTSLRNIVLGTGSLALGFMASLLLVPSLLCHQHHGHGPPVVTVVTAGPATVPSALTPVTRAIGHRAPAARARSNQARPVRSIRPAPDPHTIVDITRAAFDHHLGQRPVAGQARLVPRLVAGKSVGVKLYSIRPGSLFAVLGLRNGDVLQTINSVDILGEDYPAGLSALQHPPDFVDIGLVRDGVPARIVVLIHDSAPGTPGADGAL